MSEESREQILHDFQECSGFENIEDCIHVLEEHQWNLINALQAIQEHIGPSSGNDNESTVPVQHTTTTTTTTNNNKRQSDPNDQDQSRVIRPMPDYSLNVQGTSGPIRDLHFTIEYCDQTENIIVFDNETVHHLRLKIAERVPVPPTKQHFLNWTMRSYDDRTLLKDLHLPKENKIHLVSTDNRSTTTQNSNPTTTSTDFPITVLYDDKSRNVTTHKLTLKSNTTIHEMKKQIENLTHVPIDQQSWQGLLGAKDSDELHQTTISPQAILAVKESDTSANVTTSPTRRNIKHSIVTAIDQNDDEQMDIDHDNGLESFEDDETSPLSHNNSTTTTASSTRFVSDREPLIPDDCTDDVSALEHYSRVFNARYHSTGPILYIGSLDKAIQDSVQAPIHNRRPLAIYLHNDQSVCANVFCSQVLSTDSIIEYLANNYVFWAWDVTTDTNKTRLFETLRRCVGNQCVQRVGALDNDTFPLILVLIRTRGTLELVNIIEGKCTPSEVLSNLIQSYESFEQQRLRDVDEEVMREKRENLKKQQEDEYEQSRQADLAKERAKQEAEHMNEQLKQQRLQQQQESKARLPDEPNETEKNITRLKIRLPDDEGVLMRRFRISETLQVLFDYLTSEGRMLGEYKLLTTYPKRDLTSIDDKSQTLEQLKLYPQEQLILESL